MNPTTYARSVFVVTLLALAATTLAAASSLAPAPPGPSLQSARPAVSTPVEQALEPLPAARVTQPTPAADPPAPAPSTRPDRGSPDSMPPTDTPSVPEAPHSQPVVKKSATPPETPHSQPVLKKSATPPEAGAAEELSNTSGDRPPVEVEITVSRLPDPPDVAASNATAIVEVPIPQVRPNDPWAPVRECESGGNYSINTGNGFYGAYQFSISSWDWVAGKVGRRDLVGLRPDRAAQADQDSIAQALAFEVAGGGLRHWPVCGRRYGA